MNTNFVASIILDGIIITERYVHIVGTNFKYDTHVKLAIHKYFFYFVKN